METVASVVLVVVLVVVVVVVVVLVVVAVVVAVATAVKTRHNQMVTFVAHRTDPRLSQTVCLNNLLYMLCL